MNVKSDREVTVKVVEGSLVEYKGEVFGQSSGQRGKGNWYEWARRKYRGKIMSYGMGYHGSGEHRIVIGSGTLTNWA